MSRGKARIERHIRYWVVLPMARPAGLEHRLRSLLAADSRHEGLRRTVSSVIVCSTAAACVALSVFRLRDASATEPALKTPAQRTPGYTKTLSGGVQVSLAAVWQTNDGGENSDSKQFPLYWKADGAPLQKPQLDDWPLAHALSEEARIHKSTGANTHVSFVFSGLAVGQNISISRIGGDLASNTSTRLDDGRVVWNYTYTPVDGKREDAFEVGVTSGRPTIDGRVSLAHLARSNRTDLDMKALGATRPRPNFARVYKADSGSPAASRVMLDTPGTFQVLFGTSGTYDAKNLDRELVVVDKDGNVVEPICTKTTREPNYIYQIILMSPENARRAAFIVSQSRTRSLVTIDHVAVKPNSSHF